MSIIIAFSAFLAVVAGFCWIGLKRLGPEPEYEPTPKIKES